MRDELEGYVGNPCQVTEGDGGEHCWTFLLRVLRERKGIILPDYEEIIDLSDFTKMKPKEGVGLTKDIVKQEGEWAEVESPRRWDVGMYLMGMRLHVGLFVDSRRVLHMKQGTGSRIEFSEKLGNSIGIYRHRSLL